MRFDPDSGDVGREIVEMMTPQTPLPLLEGLLEAAAEEPLAPSWPAT